MFTGIVEELGEVTAVEDLGAAARLAVRGPVVAGDAEPGASIAVNGICLTVVDADQAGGGLTFDVMRETLDRSSLGVLKPGAQVNLERAATLASRLGGHLVQGHVDGVGQILARSPDEHWELITIGLPPQLGRYVVEKGSIAVDGVSLTVVSVTAESFTVSLIPTTLRVTTLGQKAIGEPVNLEVDVIAKYVEKLLPTASADRPTG
ncbi:MAG: riboflavin synthase [Mycobacteriales bacterium]